ncbi:hypothetical protein KAH37_01525 [bacterium]|nr:hypothetical protein [bacterium]
MRSKLMILFALLLLSACGELLLVTVTLAYPLDDKSADTYTVDVTKAMNEADAALKSQTGGVVDGVLVAAEAAIKKELEAQYGTNIIVEFSYNPKPTVGLDELLILLNGEIVKQSITTDVTVKDSSGTVIATETETAETEIDICDFAETLTFDFGDVKILLQNVDSYCADKTTEKPYLYMEQISEPVIIKLSEDEEMKKYMHYIEKIFSATINDIGFIVQEVPSGLEATASDTDALITLKGDFFSQPSDFMVKKGDIWESCNRETPDAGCEWVGINPESGQPEDFYAGDNITSAGKYYEQFYNVGAFTADGIAKDDEVFLQYTYYGKDILQRSIKSLDFKTGIKARYTFRPGSTRLSGEFVAKINAEFLMVVEPF